MQFVFRANLGETLVYAVSVSIMGLCASITLIFAVTAAVTHTFRFGKSP